MSHVCSDRRSVSVVSRRVVRLASVLMVLSVAGAAHAQCGLSFHDAFSQNVSNGPRSIATEDLNGDGAPDMIVANITANTVSIFMGVGGNNSFSLANTLTTGSGPYQVVTGDLNGDGKLDIVTANSTGNSCSVFLGSGGGFSAQPPVTVASTPRGLALADLNGDGFPDLVVANSASANIYVFPGLGNGSFGSRIIYSTANNPNSVLVGDVNADGVLDVLVACGGTNGVSVFFGTGSGTLLPGSLVAGIGGGGAQLVDVNADGKLDILVLNQGSNQLFVSLGSGNGTFQAAQVSSVPNVGNGWTFSTADFDGDGKLDVVVPRSNVNLLGVYLGAGNGTFTLATSLSTGASPVCAIVADLNIDGKPDVVCANTTGNSINWYRNTFSVGPVFTTQPAGGAFPTDSDVTLTAAVNAVSSASLQWHLNGSPLANGPHYSGVTTPTLSILAFGRVEAGSYTCVATGCSTVTSNAAALTVQAPNTCGADFNNDGFLDFTDFDAFVQEFEAGC